MSAGSTTIDNIKLCCFTFQAIMLEIWNEKWKAMVKKSLIISNWPDLFWGQSSLWSSAPTHTLAHLGIALKNSSLSDDHLTKYLTKCETDQILFWNISYLKKSSQLKMGQRYSSSHILKFQFPQGHFHSAMSHSKIWASRLATHAPLDELMNFVLGLWLQAYIEASVKKA